MEKYFEGYYFRNQKDDHTLCVIAGHSHEKKFIQIITNDFSAEFPFTKGNFFWEKGFCLDLHTSEMTIKGSIQYGEFSPIRYDIMGPFVCLPMECRHGIVSMRHSLKGSICINGETWDFADGVGYIEKDSGYSFPSSYLWIQANDFFEPAAVMAAVAEIPMGTALFGNRKLAERLNRWLRFRGCICVIQYRGREYRLASYLGVRVRLCTRERVVLTQGKYRLEIRVKNSRAYGLSAPRQGAMTRIVREAAACPAEFRFYVRGEQLFCLRTKNAAFEWEAGVQEREES